jgi:hypothetical protein
MKKASRKPSAEPRREFAQRGITLILTHDNAITLELPSRDPDAALSLFDLMAEQIGNGFLELRLFTK